MDKLKAIELEVGDAKASTLQVINEALGRKDRTVENLKDTAKLLIDSGNLKAAISVYIELSKKTKEDFNLHIGSCFFTAGLYEQAIYFLKQAQVARGVSEPLSLKIAVALKRLGKFDLLKAHLMQHLSYAGFSEAIFNFLLQSDHIFLTEEEICFFKQICPAHVFDKAKIPFVRKTISPHRTKGAAKADKESIGSLLIHENPIANFHELVAKNFIVLADDVILTTPLLDELPDVNMFTYWDKQPPRAEVVQNVDTWKAFSSVDQPIVSDEIARAFIASNLDSDVLAAYDAARHPAMKSDIFRIAALQVEGGIYIDADQVRGQRLHHLLSHIKLIAPRYLIGLLIFDGRHYIASNIIYCDRPNAPLINTALSMIVEKHKAGVFESTQSINTITGPSLLTAAFLEEVLRDPTTLTQTSIVSRSVMDLFLPQGGSSYKADASLNWRGH